LLFGGDIILYAPATRIRVMTTSLTVVAPHTGKPIKKFVNVFEGGVNLVRNGTLHFVFWLRQSSEITLRIRRGK